MQHRYQLDKPALTVFYPWRISESCLPSRGATIVPYVLDCEEVPLNGAVIDTVYKSWPLRIPLYQGCFRKPSEKLRTRSIRVCTFLHSCSSASKVALGSALTPRPLVEVARQSSLLTTPTTLSLLALHVYNILGHWAGAVPPKEGKDRVPGTVLCTLMHGVALPAASSQRCSRLLLPLPNEVNHDTPQQFGPARVSEGMCLEICFVCSALCPKA